MSETEMIKGKLVKIDLEGKTKFEDIMELCKSKGIEIRPSRASSLLMTNLNPIMILSLL